MVQLVANSVLFGQGSDYGLALGMTFASIFAFFDILLHFNAGELGSQVRAPDLPNRLVGNLAIAIGMITALLVNLSMVHLRLVTRVSGIGAIDEEWLPSLRSAPFGFEDFLSWGLLVVGLLCSLLAFRSGFRWDEPIPLFRRAGRRILRLREDRDDLREERLALSAKLEREFQNELNSIDRRAEDHVSVISDSVKRIDQVLSEYESFCTTAEVTLGAVIGDYRDENRRHRTEASPAFFSAPVTITFDNKPMRSSETTYKVVTQAEGDHDELRKTLPLAREELKKLAKNADADG